MAIKVEIKAGRSISPAEYIMDGLEFGAYDDAFRLTEAADDSSVVIYDPKRLGRGTYAEANDGVVMLGLNLPADKNDIRIFFELINRACAAAGVREFAWNDAATCLDDTEALKAETVRESEKALAELGEKLKAERGKYAEIIGALNMITLSATDVVKFGTDLEKFGDFLHEKQDVNAYYCAPQFYQDPADGSFVGVYPVQAGVRTIMPFEASLPFYMEGDEPRWYVYVYVSDDEYGYVTFKDFALHAPKQGAYDAVHYFCELTEEQAQMLIKNYGAEV